MGPIEGSEREKERMWTGLRMGHVEGSGPEQKIHKAKPQQNGRSA